MCERLNHATELLTAIVLALTVGVTLMQVVFRYGLDSSLSWSEELARYLFIWVIFLGTASATRHGQHMAVEALASVLPVSVRRPMAILVGIVSILFFGVVFYTGTLLTENAVPQMSTALEISVALVYIAAPIGAALTILHLINGIIQIAAGDAPALQTATDIS
jgi:TRAP-type C4-dicarboxylate transport system permease small subunit